MNAYIEQELLRLEHNDMAMKLKGLPQKWEEYKKKWLARHIRAIEKTLTEREAMKLRALEIYKKRKQI